MYKNTRATGTALPMSTAGVAPNVVSTAPAIAVTTAAVTDLINDIVAMVKGKDIKVTKQYIDDDTSSIPSFNEKKEALKNVVTIFGKHLKLDIEAGKVKRGDFVFYKEFFKYLNDQIASLTDLETEQEGFINNDIELFRVLKNLFVALMLNEDNNTLDKPHKSQLIFNDFYNRYALLGIYPVFTKALKEIMLTVECMRAEVQVLLDKQLNALSENTESQNLLDPKQGDLNRSVINIAMLDLKTQLQFKIRAAARVDFDFFLELFLCFHNIYLGPAHMPFCLQLYGEKKNFGNVFRFFEDIIMAMMIKAIIKSRGLDMKTMDLDQLYG
jgi:hypothetical protein